MNQTFSPITEIKNHFPDAAFVTPAMIAKAINSRPQRVRHFCRRLFPQHRGYYRFWVQNNARSALHEAELEELLCVIKQASRANQHPINIL